MSVFVIVNPKAGGGKTAARWPDIRSRLNASLIDYEYGLTNGPGDATRLAREALGNGARLIIAVGGDGTANEILNGFIDKSGRISTDVALAIMPSGTGSDFCRTIGLDDDPQNVIDRIVAGNERRIDVGNLKHFFPNGEQVTRLFLNIASFGLSGLICHNINHSDSSRMLPGKMHYLVKTLASLASYQPVRIRLHVDDNIIEEDIMLAAIANGRYFGGGMMVAPDADPQDGLLDVVALRAMSKIRLARKIGKVYRGTHIGLPEVISLRGSKLQVKITASGVNENALLEVDGESPGFSDCEISVLTKALRFAV
ncbi:MAG: diacylglycerol kinase family lipid kinase [Hyphomicrobiales bacterium]|nr:diacylglycerol kinase family lipid kinase [Hyphomicrobiales bacterium]